jgi:hypothetical protein
LRAPGRPTQHLLCLAAYSSGDPSGLQYFAVWWAALAAIMGGILVWAVRRKWELSRLMFAAPGATLTLSLLPQISGRGYDGIIIDGPGALLSSIVCWYRLAPEHTGLQGPLQLFMPDKRVAKSRLSAIRPEHTPKVLCNSPTRSQLASNASAELGVLGSNKTPFSVPAAMLSLPTSTLQR